MSFENWFIEFPRQLHSEQCSPQVPEQDSWGQCSLQKWHSAINFFSGCFRKFSNKPEQIQDFLDQHPQSWQHRLWPNRRGGELSFGTTCIKKKDFHQISIESNIIQLFSSLTGLWNICQLYWFCGSANSLNWYYQSWSIQNNRREKIGIKSIYFLGLLTCQGEPLLSEEVEPFSQTPLLEQFRKIHGSWTLENYSCLKIVILGGGVNFGRGGQQKFH